MLVRDRLASVRLKVLRAEEHLRAIAAINQRFARVECEVIVQEDLDRDLGWFELRLPAPPAALSVIAGDCLYNLRSALDHLIWELVVANPPNEPTEQNMFPICTTPEAFAQQLKRQRLQGVLPESVRYIESLQPYGTADHPLRWLQHLHNTDKHRTLNVILAAASDTDLLWLRDGELVTRTTLRNDEMYHGSRLIHFHLTRMKSLLPERMQVRGEAAAFIAFDSPPDHRAHLKIEPSAASVVAVLSAISEFIRESVIDPLETCFP